MGGGRSDVCATRVRLWGQGWHVGVCVRAHVCVERALCISVYVSVQICMPPCVYVAPACPRMHTGGFVEQAS